MNDPKVKQQVAEKIRDSSNILVTVSSNPSVDELSAALGLTLLLNKMDKHATAVFSGSIPPAITFLDPEKTFEDTTDSLRDFIIALDKEKADHLRYKLEGDLVKIYITPFRTTITSDDLEFSQGDYNVELVIALGVEHKDHLDAALDGHGKILHDATVITLTAGEQVSNLGSIDWHDSNASSLSEMLTSLHEAMKLDKKLLDKSIATAWLTGIVAATERFSNPRTTSRVMTLAANLMAAGADQQLIAARLEEATDEDEPKEGTVEPQDAQESSDKTALTEGEKTKLSKEEEPAGAEPPRPNGELIISHEKKGTIEEVAKEVGEERLAESERAAERALEKHEETIAATTEESMLQPEGTSVSPMLEPVAQEAVVAPEVAPVHQGAIAYEPPVQAGPAVAPAATTVDPVFGGTLNATSEQAADDARRQIENDKNKVILSHNYIGNSQGQTFDSPVNSVGSNDMAPIADPFGPAGGVGYESAFVPPTTPTVTAPTITPPSQAIAAMQPSEPAVSELAFGVPMAGPIPPAPTLADIDSQNRVPVMPSSGDEARAAVEAAFAASAPVVNEGVAPVPVAAPEPSVPTDFGLPLPPPPPLPADFSDGMPPLPPMPDMVQATQPELLGDIFAPEAQQPFESQTAPVSSQPADLGQFRIPGQ